MSQAKNNYFTMLEEMAACSCRAAEQLGRILDDFKSEELDESLRMLHAIEYEGDECKHKLVSKLVKEFITPLEREDIMAITNQIDDVTDTVEDVLIKIYMFNLQIIESDALAFIQIIKQCCSKLLDVFKEFGNFKKSKTIHGAIVELNRLEEQGDELYISAMRKLHTSDKSAKETAAWTEIYNCLEKVCDTCEHTADLVENVIMKNT